jgi:hypothetical protein
MNLTHMGMVVSPLPLRWKDLDYSTQLAAYFHTIILLCLFDSEDGGDMFPRKVCGLSTDYTAFYFRR